MATKVESVPLTIQHGHTETHVAVKFSRPTDHVFMTPAEVDDFITALQGSKKLLAAHQAQKVTQ